MGSRATLVPCPSTPTVGGLQTGRLLAMSGEIKVDYREPVEIKDGLQPLAEIVCLDTGDYTFATLDGSHAKIERKSSGDLLSSFTSGRLARQLREIRAETDNAILLIEGWFTSTKTGKVRWAKRTSGVSWIALQNFLLSAQTAGVKVVYSPNIKMTISMLCQLYQYYQKDQHTALLARERPTFFLTTKEANRLDLLMGLPGVREVLAKRLLEYFSSPMAVFSASAEELKAVEGIGAKKARRIIEIVRGKE